MTSRVLSFAAKNLSFTAKTGRGGPSPRRPASLLGAWWQVRRPITPAERGCGLWSVKP